MEKRERKPGYFARLKKRRQLKQNIAEKNAHEPNPAPLSSLARPAAIISCPDARSGDIGGGGTTKTADPQQRTSEKPPADSADSVKAATQVKKRVKRQPPGTVEFTVGADDSFNSIALKFNITPNKLVQLNKLFSRSVYTGQKLFVPDLSQSEAETPTPQPAVVNGSQEGVSNGRPAKPIQRHTSPPSEDEGPATVKFIKMSCKYFTDGMGVVGGVLIVTPNNIMFDPHKSDPLVIEHGCEEYGLICPMEEVVSVALYDDVSRMRLKDAPPSELPQDLCPVYRPGEWERLPSLQDINPFSRYQALESKRPIFLDDIASNPSQSASEQVDKTPSDEGFTELEPTTTATNGSGEDPDPAAASSSSSSSRPPSGRAPGPGDQQAPAGPVPRSDPEEEEDHPAKRPVPRAKGKLSADEEEEDEGVAPNGSVEDGGSHRSSAVVEQEQQEEEEEEEKKKEETGADVGKAESTSSTGSPEFVSVDVVSGEPKEAEEEEEQQEERHQLHHRMLVVKGASGADGKRSPAGGPPGPPERPHGEASGLTEEERRKKTYEAEVKAWLLERMQAPIHDMLLSSEEKSKIPPMFLCFKLGKPMRKSFAGAMKSTSPGHTYGGRGKQPEYWFAVPQERVDHLYAFFVQWSPDVYGKEAREQGFVVVDELDMIDNFFSDPASCSWEIITVDEAKRRQSVSSVEAELSVEALPVLAEASALLQDDTHVEKLACRLPARVQGSSWRLAYSSQNHGTSLKTLYRNLLVVDNPVLLVIRDMDHQIFGAFSSHPFRVSEHYYGTGETFLYSFCPEIKVYRWTGDNSYFVKGNIDSLQFGGGGGQLGLWLDAELYRGTTSNCATFNNQALSAQQDFNIHSVEVWTFE